MNSDQVTGTLERLVTVMATWFLGFAVSKHWITAADSAAFLPIIIALPAAMWGIYRNRTTAIVAAAAVLPNVTSITVTDKASADAAKDAAPETDVKVQK